MEKPLISLCMIVKNEALRLEKTLEAARPHVDEMVIVDTGSSDGTQDIARRFTDRVYTYEWNDDFSAARNFAISKCSGRWLLNLDADHVLHVDAHIDLREILKNTTYLAYFVDERSVAPGKKYASLHRMLLFRNKPGFRYRGIIHEHPMDSIQAYAEKNHSGKAWANLPGVFLEHSGYTDPRLKLQRNRPILEKAVAREEDNFHYRYKLLLTYKALDEMDIYGLELNKSVRLILDKNPPMRESVIGIWALYGEWAREHGTAESLEIFKSGARQIGTKSFWKDGRLTLALSRVLIDDNDPAAAHDILKRNIQQGISAPHISFSDEDKLEVAALWLWTAVEVLPVEEILKIMARRRQLFQKARIDEEALRDHIVKNYPALVSWCRYEPEKESTPAGVSISLCMITRDEEKNLPRCLDSVKELVDEIIIVDTGSKDRTMEIARGYGAKVLRFEWKGDFATMRNLALKEARHPWILHLDADEELESLDRETLRLVLDQSAEGLAVVLRNHQPAGDMVRYLDERQIRFFRNKPSIRYRNKVHEQIGPSILEQGGEIVDANIIIHHYGYEKNNEQRARRNLQMLSSELRERPDDAYVLFKLGETYKALNDFSHAAEFLKKALRNPGGNIGNEIKEMIYLRLAQIELSNSAYESAVEYAEGCLRFNPYNYVAMYVAGVGGMYSGRIEQSLAYFLKLRENRESHSIDLSDMENLIHALEQHSDLRSLH